MICCCSMAGTLACEECMRRQGYIKPYNSGIVNMPRPLKKRTVIEKFDKEGKLIERIIEE